MIIGLTGQSGAGKSTVASLFAAEGFRIIDCDALVHTLYGEKTCTDKISEAFGEEYIAEGRVDRKKLGSLVFTNKPALTRLNEIVRPLILEAVMGELNRARFDDVNAVLDAPLLFEYELQNMCDTTLGIVCDLDIAEERLSQRDGKTPEELRGRLAAQHDASYFRANCEHILENNGDEQTLKMEFYALLASLMPTLKEPKIEPERIVPSEPAPRKKKMEKSTVLAGIAILLVIVFVAFAAGGAALVNRVQKLFYPRNYEEAVDEVAMRFGMEPNLIYAIIKAESGFAETAVSSAGAIGLMQIIPDTFLFDIRDNIGLSDAKSAVLFEAEENILAGTYYFTRWYDYFYDVYALDDPTVEALAAYNAGIGNVWKWLEDDDLHDWNGLYAEKIPFEETREYVERVLRYKEKYDALYGKGMMSTGRVSEAYAYRYAKQYGEDYGIDPRFVMAVIRAESTFDPLDTSHSGAMGLMQITKSTFVDIKSDLHLEESYKDLYDPALNIRCGTYYLSWADERVEGLAQIAATYNAGLTNVQSWLADPRYSNDGKTLIVENIPIETTRRYVGYVLSYYEDYVARFPLADDAA